MMHPTLLPREELLQIIREVRTRWRWKVALRSLTVLVGAGVMTLLGAAYGLEQFRFSPSAIVVFRIVTYLVLVALGWLFFVKPLARRVTNEQVALYLEEHEPSLDSVLMSAVDATETTEQASGRPGGSAVLLRRLVESAIERCQQVDFGRRLERPSIRRLAAVLTTIGVLEAVVFVAGPAYLRHGALALLLPVRGVEAASPYRIDVKPGAATVARGADIGITARLVGFTRPEVDIFTRSSPGAPFERASLVAAEAGGLFEGMLFGLKTSTEYFVQSAGVRSPVFRLEVADLPRVERLEMEYVFPSYTGLPPQIIERGGDVAVLRGTTVRVRVHVSMPSKGGRILLDERDAHDLTVQTDGVLTGSFEVKQDGFYRIDLQSPAGTTVTASPAYTIDVLADQAPTVSFAKPGRDVNPTSVEEVFLEARADDDFGVRRLDLLFSVNGAQERSVPLVAAGARPLKEVTAGHTFFLEELNLQPGDVVSYYARATDNDAVQGAKSVASDMYFLKVRPFRKDYRAIESQAAGQAGAGGGGSNDPSVLSEQQRRIVSGTFNVARDRDKTAADKFRENVVFLTLAQGQLRERADMLSTQISSRAGAADAMMRQIATWLADAAKSMRAAEGKLQVRDPKQALPAQQQALGSLLRAEEAYRDVRVMLNNERGGGGGGGSGQSSPAAAELADLFQLEMDKLRNQYETFQRTEQQSANTQADALLERLKELAHRQEQEAERQRQMASNRQDGATAAGARQRQLADETEEAARRLERLSREANRPDLAAAARQVREAADAMRRAAARSDAGAVAEARGAADRLDQARNRLEQQRTDRMSREINDALARVERLQESQAQVQRDVRALGQPGTDRRKQTDPLLERKDAQATEVADLERQLDRTASEFRRERPEAARQVQESADAIRDGKLKEKIRYSKGLVQGAPPDTAAGFEEQIGSDMAGLEERLRKAAAAAASPERDARAEAANRARALVRGVESMDQRMRERQQQSGGQQQGGEQQRGQQQGGQQQAGQQQGGQQGQAGGGRQGQQGGQQNQQGQGGSRRPGLFGPDDARQFAREARERQNDAQQLRHDLQALGVEATDLEALIANLRALGAFGASSNPEELARLQTHLVEGFRRFEFELRRKLGVAGADQLFLTGTDEVPPDYRKLVEDYYRALARAKKK